VHRSPHNIVEEAEVSHWEKQAEVMPPEDIATAAVDDGAEPGVEYQPCPHDSDPATANVDVGQAVINPLFYQVKARHKLSLPILEYVKLNRNLMYAVVPIWHPLLPSMTRNTLSQDKYKQTYRSTALVENEQKQSSHHDLQVTRELPASAHISASHCMDVQVATTIMASIQREC
jgi:hypothetical protein